MAARGPEWDEVEVLETTGSNPLVKCNHCKKQFSGGATRIKQHILGIAGGVKACIAASREVKIKFEKRAASKAEEASTKRKAQELDRATSDTATAATAASAGSTKRPALAKNQTTIQAAFDRNIKAEVDQKVARFFYGCGVPFNVARSKWFKEMVEAIGRVGAAYTPPGSEALRTTLLDKEVLEVKSSMAGFLRKAQQYGASLGSDGWTNAQARPLLNFMLSAAEGAMFLSAVDTSGHAKTAEYIADCLIKAIDNVGPENITIVCTDSASSCKAAGKLITEHFPHISWVPCAAHCLDLLLEDIGKFEWVAPLIESSRSVVLFITNHQRPHATYRKHTKLELLKPGETRFATAFILMARLVEVRQALEKTVVDDDWSEWVAGQAPSVRERAKDVKKLVIKDEFWADVGRLVDLCWPILEVLRLMDSPLPTMGKVYWRCFKLQEHVDGFNMRFSGVNKRDGDKRKKELAAVLRERWDMLFTDMHAAGYTLDPEYWGHDATSEELVGGMMDVVSRMLPEAEAAEAMRELAKYRNREGLFARDVVQRGASTTPGHQWWDLYGIGVPNLQRVAMRVLSLPASACACERNWSTFDFIHNKRRNRLQAKRAADLVYVFSNLRLREDMQALDHEAAAVEWEESSDDGEEPVASEGRSDDDE